MPQIDYNKCHIFIEDVILDLLTNPDYNLTNFYEEHFSGKKINSLSEFVLLNKNYLYEKMNDQSYTKNFVIPDGENLANKHFRELKIINIIFDIFPIASCQNDSSEFLKFLPRLYDIYNN